MDCTALLEGMVFLGAVLCALEAGVMAAAISFKWHRKWTVLLKLSIFGHFRWCELHLVSPILKRSLVVGVRGASHGGAPSPGEAQRDRETLQNGLRNLPLCVLLSMSPCPRSQGNVHCLPVRVSVGLALQKQNCCPLAVILFFLKNSTVQFCTYVGLFVGSGSLQ